MRQASNPSGPVHDTNAVLAAELVGLARGTLGIILPLAVHQKAVFVLAGRQGDGLLPNAVFVLLE